MTTFRFDEWTLYADVGDLERDGKRQRLQDLPLKVLIELLKSPGELVTREQLIACLWPKGVVDFETSLNTAISKLRTALGDNADSPRYIETVPRKGYRFIGQLVGPENEAKPADSKTDTPPALETSRTSTPKRSFYWSGVAALILVIGAILFTTLSNRSTGHVRLAVLPFENLSPDPANAFFTDGIHDELLSALAERAPQMDVISRTTMMTYRSKLKSVGELGKELAATHVVEGSVRREGQTVRVIMQLIDARSDDHLWSKTYDRQVKDTMTLQSHLAQEVATQLSINLSPYDAALPPSTSAKAYDLYLQAKPAVPAINQRTSPETVALTESRLDQAIALDPNFAGAYVQRAQLRIIKFVWNFDLSESNIQGARADIDAARRLAGDHPTVIQVDSRYNVLRSDSDSDPSIPVSSARARQLLEAPQYVASKDPSVMRWRAFSLCRTGSPEEGLKVFAQLNELDPNNVSNVYAWTRELWNMRQGLEAIRAVRAFNRRGVGTLDSGDLVFAFTGVVAPLRADVERMSDAVDPDTRLTAWFDVLRYEQRYAELHELLQKSTASVIRPRGFREPSAPGVGSKPLAELHGWAKMLSGDSASAAADGRALLKFAAEEPLQTRNGAGYTRILKAEGFLFSGDKATALTEARTAFAIFGLTHNNPRRYAATLVARIYAWAGAEDEAVDLLEELSTKFPMLGPAEITRDPLYSIPLKNNARYQALEKKLEAEIAENQKPFK